MTHDSTDRAAALLTEAEASLARGELRLARRALATARSLGADDDSLDARISAAERLAGPLAGFEAARERGDWIAARDHARRAAEVASEPEPYLAAAERCAANVRADWGIVDLEVDLPLDADPTLVEITRGSLETSRWQLLDDGATLLHCAAHHRSVFLREIDVASRRIRRVGWVRAPGAVDPYAPAQVVGDRIWFSCTTGEVVELSRSPLDVVRCVSLRDFMLPDRHLTGFVVAPPGRYVWANVDHLDEDRATVVVDTDTFEARRPPYAEHFWGIAGTSPSRVAGSDVMARRTRIFDASGRTVPWRAPEGVAHCAIVSHPLGAGYVALVGAPPDDETQSRYGLVECLEGQPPSEVVEIEDTMDEMDIGIATSRACARTFVLAHVGDDLTLIAFRSGLDGIRATWSVPVPSDACLVTDAEARHVLLVSASLDRLDVVRLGEDAPSLAPPPFEAVMWRGGVRINQELDDDSRELVDALRSVPDRRVDAWIETQRKRHRKAPARLASLVEALIFTRRLTDAESVLTYALERYPSDATLALARGELAVAYDRWSEVIATLSSIDSASLEGGRARRVYLLLAAAHLEAGRPDVACDLLDADPDAASTFVADGLRRIALALADSDACDAPALRAVVRACRAADAHLADADFDGARRALDIPAVHAHPELQSSARLAEAHLGLSPSSPLEVVGQAQALARFVGTDDWTTNLPGLGWSRERIDDVRRRAAAWLDESAVRLVVDVEALDARPAPTEESPEPAAPDHPSRDAGAPETHEIAQLPHERIRRAVPVLDAAVLETTRYVRALPEWDESRTLGEDLLDLGTMKRGLDALPYEIALHADYCTNFELHRRKLFFIDAALTWMLEKDQPRHRGQGAPAAVSLLRARLRCAAGPRARRRRSVRRGLAAEPRHLRDPRGFHRRPKHGAILLRAGDERPRLAACHAAHARLRRRRRPRRHPRYRRAEATCAPPPRDQRDPVLHLRGRTVADRPLAHRGGPGRREGTREGEAGPRREPRLGTEGSLLERRRLLPPGPYPHLPAPRDRSDRARTRRRRADVALHGARALAPGPVELARLASAVDRALLEGARARRDRGEGVPVEAVTSSRDSSKSQAETRRGFAHHHTDEQLRAYRKLSAEQKLRWLHEAWRFTVDFVPERKRRVMQKIRSGEI